MTQMKLNYTERLMIVTWLRQQPTERAINEIALLRKTFGITRDLARELRAEAHRSMFNWCGCCTGVGDHPCGHECQACDGSGRNPIMVHCVLPHGVDCGCDWAENTDWAM